jgi:pyruvate/2-oxoglutarate dehydrogenase complex dihydrolipoamide dehydrogenase (E3) component
MQLVGGRRERAPLPKRTKKENPMNRRKTSPERSASKSEPEEYDLIVLGSGAGAKISAWTLAAEGQRVALVERKYIGGSCPNIACLPSKNIVQSAKVAQYFRTGEDYGVVTHGFTVDMSKVRERKRQMVSGLVDVHLHNFKQSGVELILAQGRFVAPKTIEASLSDRTTRVLRGKRVVIGTGTHAALEAIPGLAEAQPLTHVEALELDSAPEHLLVLGGGYVGLEFAQAMRRFGSKVTVIDRNDRLMNNEDDDVAEAVGQLFADEGIDVRLNSVVKRVSGKSGESVQLVVEKNGAEETVEGTHLLMATGRVPNTSGIGLDIAGVELTESGYVKVNERLETTAPDVWALGEVAGSPKFTHVSEDDFRIFYENINGRHRVTTGRQVPFCLYTDPEVARIGLTEKQAKEQGIAFRLFKVPMNAILRARSTSELRGFMKALVEAKGNRILGFTAFAASAGETMGAVHLAMLGGVPYTVLRDAMLAHPTFVEGLGVLFSAKPTAVPSTAEHAPAAPSNVAPTTQERSAKRERTAGA